MRFCWLATKTIRLLVRRIASSAPSPCLTLPALSNRFSFRESKLEVEVRLSHEVRSLFKSPLRPETPIIRHSHRPQLDNGILSSPSHRSLVSSCAPCAGKPDSKVRSSWAAELACLGWRQTDSPDRGREQAMAPAREDARLESWLALTPDIFLALTILTEVSQAHAPCCQHLSYIADFSELRRLNLDEASPGGPTERFCLAYAGRAAL